MNNGDLKDLKDQMDGIMHNIRNSSKSLIDIFKNQEKEITNYKELVDIFCNDLYHTMSTNLSLRLEVLEFILNEVSEDQKEDFYLTFIDEDLIKEAYIKKKYGFIVDIYYKIKRHTDEDSFKRLEQYMKNIFKSDPISDIVKYTDDAEPNENFIIFIIHNFGMDYLRSSLAAEIASTITSTLFRDKDKLVSAKTIQNIKYDAAETTELMLDELSKDIEPDNPLIWQFKNFMMDGKYHFHTLYNRIYDILQHKEGAIQNIILRLYFTHLTDKEFVKALSSVPPTMQIKAIYEKYIATYGDTKVLYNLKNVSKTKEVYQYIKNGVGTGGMLTIVNFVRFYKKYANLTFKQKIEFFFA